MALQIGSHLAYMILIPILLWGSLGLFIDRQLGTLPGYLLISIGLALSTTIYWIAKRLRTIIELKSKLKSK